MTPEEIMTQIQEEHYGMCPLCQKDCKKGNIPYCISFELAKRTKK